MSLPSRRINWYLASGNPANVDLVAQYGGTALTGALLCCDLGNFAADGSFLFVSPASVATSLEPFRGLDAWFVISINEASVASGSWRNGMVAAAAESARLISNYSQFRGFVVDYEPEDNYTASHAAAYGSFLKALAAATAPACVGLDIANWGILGPHLWPYYNFPATPSQPALGLFTSMTPTYNANNVTLNEIFVEQALATFPRGTYAAGVGTMLEPDAPGKCGWDYLWNETTFAGFVSFMAQAGVVEIDVWRCDIDHYSTPDGTAPWMIDALAKFLATPIT